MRWKANTSNSPEAGAMRKLEGLKKSLRNSFCQTYDDQDKSKSYIPNNVLDTIVTPDAISTILPLIAEGATPAELDNLAQTIVGRRSEKNDEVKQYRKVFVILILIKKVDSIHDFVKAEITDASLPLLRINERSLRSFDLCPSDNNEAISFINAWDDEEIELFEKEQWGILAPFFSSKTEEKDGVRHYKFSSRERLPFQLIDDQPSINANRTTKTNDTVNSMSSEASEVVEPMKGAHGRVWRVKINKAHHDLPSYRASLTLLSVLSLYLRNAGQRLMVSS